MCATDAKELFTDFKTQENRVCSIITEGCEELPLSKKREFGIVAGSRSRILATSRDTGNDRFSCPTKHGCSLADQYKTLCNDATDSENRPIFATVGGQQSLR